MAKTNNGTKRTYVESSDYFPKEIRKMVGIGEFEGKTVKAAKKPAKKTVKK